MKIDCEINWKNPFVTSSHVKYRVHTCTKKPLNQGKVRKVFKLREKLGNLKILQKSPGILGHKIFK